MACAWSVQGPALLPADLRSRYNIPQDASVCSPKTVQVRAGGLGRLRFCRVHRNARRSCMFVESLECPPCRLPRQAIGIPEPTTNEFFSGFDLQSFYKLAGLPQSLASKASLMTTLPSDPGTLSGRH